MNFFLFSFLEISNYKNIFKFILEIGNELEILKNEIILICIFFL